MVNKNFKEILEQKGSTKIRYKRKISTTPFDDVFRTLLEKCTKLIIPVINEFFHTDYTFKDKVDILANELFFTDADGSDVKRITDSYLRIRDNIYHIECQSTKDNFIQLRMMEYDFHIGFDNATNDDGTFITMLPQSAILNLFSDRKGESMQKVILLIPEYSETDAPTYKEVTYSVPVFNINYYSHKEIREKHLLFLTPYYIIKFRESLDEINADAEKLTRFTEEQLALYEEIERLAEAENFEKDYLHDVISLTEKIINYVAKNSPNIKREVSIMGGEVIKTDREILIEENLAKGEQLGLAKGKQLGLAEGEQLGLAKAEDLLQKLTNAMIADKYDSDTIVKINIDADFREEMYRKYDLK